MLQLKTNRPDESRRVLMAGGRKGEIPRDARSQLFFDVDQQMSGVFRLSGKSYHRPEFDNPSTLGLSDPEDRHSFHRLYWVARYARALAHGHAGCNDALLRHLQYWFEKRDQFGPEMNAPYTLAERLASFAEALFWMKGLPDASAVGLDSIKEQIHLDGSHLLGNLEYGLGIHNHLLNDARGLHAAGRLTDNEEEAQALRAAAFKLWDEYFPALLLEDGALDEQSSHYHFLLCRTALEYWLAAQESGHTLPAGLQPKLHAMFELANDLLRTDGSLPRFGDNSPDRTIQDLWGLLAAAHSSGLLKSPPRHDAVTPLTQYYSGSVNSALAEPAAGFSTRVYAASGYAFIRRDDNQVEVAVHADPVSAADSHGDAGRGSYELWWRGTVVIREPGSFLRPGHPRSAYYRSAEAQNATLIAGLAPSVSIEDQRRMAEWYWIRGDSLRELPDGSLLWRCNAFKRLAPSLTLSRNWSFTSDGHLVVEEQVEGSGAIEIKSRILLGDLEWGPLVKEEDVWKLQSKGLPQGDCLLTMRLPEEATMRLELASYTPEYGVEHGALAIVVEGKVPLPVYWEVRFEFNAKADSGLSPDPLPPLQAKACAA